MTNGERRLYQLSLMMSHITGMPKDYCSGIIQNTLVGQNILEENEVTMYDQQTANLYDIATELKFIVDKLTTDNIVDAMMNLHILEKEGDTH